MTEAGPLGRFLMAILVIGVLVTAFSVTIGDFSNKYNINISDNVNRTFNYTQNVIDDINELRTEATNKTSWIDEVKENVVFMTLPLRIGRLILVTPIDFIRNSVSSAASSFGLPEQYGAWLGNLVIALIIISLVLAFAAIFIRRSV